MGSWGETDGGQIRAIFGNIYLLGWFWFGGSVNSCPFAVVHVLFAFCSLPDQIPCQPETESFVRKGSFLDDIDSIGVDDGGVENPKKRGIHVLNTANWVL